MKFSEKLSSHFRLLVVKSKKRNRKRTPERAPRASQEPFLIDSFPRVPLAMDGYHSTTCTQCSLEEILSSLYVPVSRQHTAVFLTPRSRRVRRDTNAPTLTCPPHVPLIPLSTPASRSAKQRTRRSTNTAAMTCSSKSRASVAPPWTRQPCVSRGRRQPRA